jgi:hypothetical protein
MKMALEALTDIIAFDRGQRRGTYQDYVAKAEVAMAGLSSAISEAEAGDKPVAWLFSDGMHAQTDEPGDKTHFSPLFLTPPTHTAAVQAALEKAAKVADGFSCGSCGMDGKVAAAIRAINVLEGK